MNEKTHDPYVEKNDGFITFHKLLAFKQCPMFYKLKFVDKVLPPLSNDALIFGSAFDEFLHDETVLENKYRVVAVRNVAVNGRKNKIETAEKKIELSLEKLSQLCEENRETSANSLEAEEKVQKKILSDLGKIGKKIEKENLKIDALKEDIKQLEAELEELDGTKELTETMGTLMNSCLREFKRQPLYKRFPKARIEWEHGGHKFRGELDGLSIEKTNILGNEYKGLMVDDKTCGSIDLLKRYLLQYKEQGAWYGWGLKNATKVSFWDDATGSWVETKVEKGLELPFQINAVTKDLPFPRSLFLFADTEELGAIEGGLISDVENMIETMERGIYPVADRDTWMETEGYGFTDYDLQESLSLF